MSETAYWDYSFEKTTTRIFTREETHNWLDGVTQRKAQNLVKTSKALERMGFNVRPYRDLNDKKVALIIWYRDSKGKNYRLASFKDGVETGQQAGMFSAVADQSREDLLPIKAFISKVERLIESALERRGLPETEFPKLAPFLLAFKIDQALSLYEQGIDFMDAVVLAGEGIPTDGMQEYVDVPIDWVRKLMVKPEVSAYDNADALRKAAQAATR
jgi:hypothetical protein